MKCFSCAVGSLALACLVVTAAPRADNKLPEAARTILEKAEQFELLSVDPKPQKEDEKDGFHGHKVLGKTAVKDADVRKQLVEALVKGMEGEITPAKCFNPRHGIRATHDGKTVELLICFECAQLQVYDGPAGQGKFLLVSKAPEPVFDKVLQDAKIPKAK